MFEIKDQLSELIQHLCVIRQASTLLQKTATARAAAEPNTSGRHIQLAW